MRKDRDKGKKITLIFDYENFVNKSSQQRYVELRNEVKNKLDKINDEINIAGSNEEEKKYNLLMHYKYLLENFEFNKELTRYIFQTTASFVAAVALIIAAWIPVVLNLNFGEWNTNVTYIFSILVILICIGMFANIYIQHTRDGRKSLEQESQQYLYYKFYYTELEKYIKEN